MGDFLPTWTVTIEWHRVYLGLAILNFGPLAGIWSVSPTVSEFSAFVIAGLVVGLYLSTATLHYWHTPVRRRTRHELVGDHR